MTAAWSAETSATEAARRAGGRRRYNAHRQALALYRRRKLARMLRAKDMLTRGYQARLARKLGVSRSTVCRDVRYLLQLGWPCPCCGAYSRPSEGWLEEVE
jgi:hypothetical protein